MGYKFLDYKDAKAFLDKYDWLKHLGVYKNAADAYDILFKVIAPMSTKQIWDIKRAMDLNGGNNEKALIDLGLIAENIRVVIIADDKKGNYVIEDMYDYLAITSQLR